MKTISKLMFLVVGLALVSADVQARGGARGGGGGGGGGGAHARAPGGGGGGAGARAAAAKGGGGARAAAANRSAPSRANAGAKRSPMTGSSVQRPASRPANKPTTRPANQPAARPANPPASRPANLPASRPANRPESRPANRPVQRPSVERPTTRPAQRPEINRPGAGPGANRPEINRPGGGGGGGIRPDNKLPDRRPGDGNGIRPGGNGGGLDNRPQFNRPGNNRPSTLPGMVTYPNRPGRDRPNIGGGNNNLNLGNRGDVNVGNINVNRRNTSLNRPSNFIGNNNNRNWDSNRWGGNRGVWGNNVNNIHINNSFRNNNNFACRPNYWGARPWWGAGGYHGWHVGHWNYGWNSYYYRRHWYYGNDNFAAGFMWGIGVWSLGNLIYDMGYQRYSNPYPAPPVVYGDSKSSITYVQPISVTAATLPPGDDAATTLAETQSAAATELSRTAFKQGDYVSALKSVDEAIAYTPGDVTLHEYRALVLFALGRYSDAAGVLNPVLASGPGWGWDTMVGFYDSSSTYTDQLRKLEAYVKGRPDAADSRFLLGYQYFVCGHLDKANVEFTRAAELQPGDSISRQLAELTKSSLPDGGEDEAEQEAPPAPVPSEKLVGTWVSDRGKDGKVTFKMLENGDYTWTYANGAESKELKGTYGLDEQGLLVLSSEDTQMVSEVTLKDENSMKFTLVGAPDGDPGLDFTKG